MVKYGEEEVLVENAIANVDRKSFFYYIKSNGNVCRKAIIVDTPEEKAQKLALRQAERAKVVAENKAKRDAKRLERKADLKAVKVLKKQARKDMSSASIQAFEKAKKEFEAKYNVVF